MKLKPIFLFTVCLIISAFITQTSYEQEPSAQYPFGEIWGYVMKGEETYLSNSMPFTDIGYFAAQINDQGELPNNIKRPDLKGEFDKPVRIHLVISAPWNKTIMNFCLRPDMPLRKNILNEILAASENFDGIQIDFESLNWEDKKNYMSFLKDLAEKIPEEKIFSVAVPARWWDNQNPFDYEEIAAIADRVIVMAYDEHWRTGEAGPIASLPWCKKVLDFALKHIPAEKLVMGAPLYGRAWQKETLARSLKYPQTLELCQEKSCSMKIAEGGSPYFEFIEPVTIAVHFEDLQSLTSKLDLYSNVQIKNIAFWRVGQEPKNFWERITAQ